MPRADGKWTDYRAENARLRAVYLKIGALRDRDDIRAQTDCSKVDAWRLSVMLSSCGPTLIDRWTRDVITWRKLWRIGVTDFPFDYDAQYREMIGKKKGRAPVAV